MAAMPGMPVTEMEDSVASPLLLDGVPGTGPSDRDQLATVARLVRVL